MEGPLAHEELWTPTNCGLCAFARVIAAFGCRSAALGGDPGWVEITWQVVLETIAKMT